MLAADCDLSFEAPEIFFSYFTSRKGHFLLPLLLVVSPSDVNNKKISSLKA